MKITSIKKIYIALTVLLLILNLFAFRMVYGFTNQVARGKLELATLDIKSRIENQISTYASVLLGAAALFNVNNQITDSQWDNYVAKLNLSESFPGIEVLGYAPVLTPAQKDAYISELPKVGIQKFSIYPDKVTTIYIPVQFAAPPTEDLKKAVGFNLATDPDRLKPIEYARDNNSIAVSNKIIPIVDIGKPDPREGVVMYYPVYKPGSDISTTEARQANIAGFIFVGIRPIKLMDELTLRAAPGLNFQVYDNSANGGFVESSLLYNSGNPDSLAPGYQSKFSSKDTIILPNTNWYIRFLALPDDQLGKFVQYFPYLVSFFNILLSIALILFVRKFLIKYSAAKKESFEYATRLINEDALVDGSDSGIIMTNEFGRVIIFNRKAEQILGYLSNEVVDRMDFLNFVSKQDLMQKIEVLQKRTGVTVKNDFDAVITDCLIDGKEVSQWVLIDKNGKSQRTEIEVRPVFDDKNLLIGYKFTF